jgi:hypothetical protein
MLRMSLKIRGMPLTLSRKGVPMTDRAKAEIVLQRFIEVGGDGDT